MIIREATYQDIKHIQDLYFQLDTDAIYYQPEHFMRNKREEDFIKGIIDSDKAAFLVVEENNKVIGFSLVQIKETPNISCLKKQTYLYILDFVIDISMRCRGYGTKLLEESKKWGIVRKTSFLRLSVFPKNEQGIRFYRKCGLMEKMITMECELLMEQ